jgi:hypothetical protein
MNEVAGKLKIIAHLSGTWLHDGIVRLDAIN